MLARRCARARGPIFPVGWSLGPEYRERRAQVRRLLTQTTNKRYALRVFVTKMIYSWTPTVYRPGPPDNSGHNIAAEALVGASRCKGDGPAL